MATQPISISAAAGRLSNARQRHPEQDHTALAQQLVLARALNAVAKITAESPPLTADQAQTVADALMHRDRTGAGVA